MQSRVQQLQQQLAALLSAALPQSIADATNEKHAADAASAPSLTDAAVAASGIGINDSARIAALESCRRTVLYPPNAHLLLHCAHFLSQGFTQLLADKSYGVRHAAAVGYGSLCAILVSTAFSSNVLSNHVLAGSLVDRFLAWALPSFHDFSIRNGTTELALDSLQEFLGSGNAMSVERYVPSILKASQELLEDERTSFSLFHQLLSLLTLISSKFSHCFQPHFFDIVDLLLGWTFMPDVPDSERCLITDSFSQFQKHWLSNLQFSFGLLSKLLGDAEVLINDASIETTPQLRRLISLFSCFSAILQSTASGVLEMNLLDHISEPLENLTPQLLRCISIFGKKFGWSKWSGGSWKCLVLIAEILLEKFSHYYPMVVDVLFQSLSEVPSSQVLRLLKANLQLLSLQKLGILPSSVQILLKFHSPLSQLRLHSNHSVVASSAATYLFFLQHGSRDIVSQAIISLFEEMEQLKSVLAGLHLNVKSCQKVGTRTDGENKSNLSHGRQFSELDLLSLLKFDLKVLSSTVSIDGARDYEGLSADTGVNLTDISARITSFILKKFAPFEFPIEGFCELQVHVIRTLCKLSEVEFHVQFADHAKLLNGASVGMGLNDQSLDRDSNKNHLLATEYLRKFSGSMARTLNISSPLGIKLEGLGWIRTFTQMVLSIKKGEQPMGLFGRPYHGIKISNVLLFSILDAAFDTEVKVRYHVASILELLLQAGLVHPENLCFISEVVLNKITDPEMSVKTSFVRLLSISVPLTLYIHGNADDCYFWKLRTTIYACECYLKWKKALALKMMHRKLHSHQFLSVFSYLSQRLKAPLSSWIRRLVFNSHDKNDRASNQLELIGGFDSKDVCKDSRPEEFVLEKICPKNNLAAIWWAIHEAARYCIDLRLRTSLGGPTQTFASLERMLCDIPSILLLDFEPNDDHYLSSSNFHLLPMRLLLDFVEALKKNVYNAYDGSSILPSATRQSSLFFRTNKKVCEEWFSRICEPMLNAGLSLNCHYATFHYCASRLQDLRNPVALTLRDQSHGASENFHNLREKFSGDIMKILQCASTALCKIHEPEALIGLQECVGQMFPSVFMDQNHINSNNTGTNLYFSWMTGLVYQARGQYEKAAAYFSHLLQSDEALSCMGSDGIQFIIARVIESYTLLSDWKSLETWLSELQALRSVHAGKAYSGALTASGNEINAIHALACFEEGEIQSAWAYLDLTPKHSCQLTLDPTVAFERSEQMLLRSMLQRETNSTDNVLTDLEKAKMMLDEALFSIPLDGLNEAAACAAHLHCIFALEECITSSDEYLPSALTSLSQLLHLPISTIRQDSSLWIKIFRIYHTVMPTSVETILLGQRLLSLARKQTNFLLAERLIQNLQKHSLSTDKHSEFLGISLQLESILLKYARGKPEDALLELWALVRDDFLQISSHVSTNISDIKAKACLKLSSWMGRKSTNMNLRTVLSKIHEDLILSKEDGMAIHSRDAFLFDSSHNSTAKCNAVVEEIIGTAAKLSCGLCPQMGKAWLSYAAWCFSQGKSSLSVHGAVLQSCSLTSILKEEISPGRFQLTKEEKSKIRAVVANFCSSKSYAVVRRDEESEQCDSSSLPEFEAFLDSLVYETACIMEVAAGAPSFGPFDGECPSAILFSQLQALFLRTFGIEKSDLTPFIVELVDIWWLLRQRRVWLFGHAAHGYFEFLSHSSYIIKESNCADSHYDSTMGKVRSCILRAMLYILAILINYGVELEETFNLGFATVAPLPWQEITPQLFAQLCSHPKKVVRKQVQGVLMMLAKISPCSIVYPLLVDINVFEGQSSEELQNIYSYMNNLDTKLIQDVQLFINELERISVLWEEQWLSTLQDLHTDVTRRINMLKEDAARIVENTALSHAEKNKITGAKYSAVMAPIIVALERRLESTSRTYETVHELWFQKEYGKQLKSTILSFKIPPASASVLGDVWQGFDAIAASLANCQRKSSICLREVAPKLALLSSSGVPMPGLERQFTILEPSGCTDFQGIITVSSFSEQVGLLSTKTRPKKLVLLGSDGQKHTYLLKGREDLHLDARIMQLLQAINCFFTSSADSLCQSLGVRYYSVTPISGQAGLIQWVDKVTSIYSVYKSWQNRNQLAQLYTTDAINDNLVPPVLRPSDMFYGKIIPALKEKGIRRVVSRRDWPHEVKRKVLLDLMRETPRQLLWQELWCASEGFKSFHSKIRRFSGSLAAMSIIGHVVGLGDRHLDNILIDFSSGEVVHIDYNVCFDKGRRLKIPEIVPFRLTQIIEAALGLTGVEGVFRANCETVINVLRKNKDIILMLLEVFVWDPLVEWTREDQHGKAMIVGEEKKGMELAVSLSLFASRFQEIRIPLQEHHDLVVSILPAAESVLKRLLGVLIEFEAMSTILYRADKERSRLLQHETTAKSIAAEASCFSEKSRAYFEAFALEFAQAKTLATEKAKEVTSWMEEHRRVLDALCICSFLDSQAYIKLSRMEDSLSLTSAVLISGVPLTVVPESTQAYCSDLDGEISLIIAKLDNELSSAIEALNEYSLILQHILPLNYIVTSPLNRWAQLLQLSANSPSADVLSHARQQAADIITDSSGTSHESVHTEHQDLLSCMETHSMEIETFNKEHSKLLSSIESDIEAKAKEHLLSTVIKHMQPEEHVGGENDLFLDNIRDFRMVGNLDEKKGEMLFLLNIAVSDLYEDVKEKLVSISKVSGQRIGWKTDDSSLNDFIFVSQELEEHIEKCILLTGFLKEVQNFVGIDLPGFNVDCSRATSEHDWATDFRIFLHSVKLWFENFTECVLAEIIETFVFHNTEVMETFESFSQIRGSIDTALENLVEVELERESLMELEKSYFMKIGVITQRQLAFQEAASRDHDHLSWEEAEELATQVEACRTQLEELHQSWNQKDVKIASLERREDHIMDSLASIEGYFSSLIKMEPDGTSHSSRRRNSFLAALVKPFTELESIDLMLSSYLSSDSYFGEPLPTLSDLVQSDFSLSYSVWRFSYIIKTHSFFVWKVGIVDSIIDTFIFDVSTSIDHNLGFDQLSSVFKKKLEVHLQKYLCQYLKERVVLALFAQLDKENENLRQMIEAKNDFIHEITTKNSEPLRSVRLMLEEYCKAQETSRVARSAAHVMNEHAKRRTDVLYITILEIFQIEWFHEKTIPQVLNTKVYLQSVFDDNKLACLVLKTNRPSLLEKLQSSIYSIARSLECLQAFERTSISAEEQIDRALEWASAGPNITGTGNSSTKLFGISSEYHDYLLRRRKLLCKAHEQASDIVKFCTYVIEFEASRESISWKIEENLTGEILDGSHSWKQANLTALTRLDNAYQSFARAEQEWKLSQNKMEAAAKSVLSATNELCIASEKAKSASNNLQHNIAMLRECVYEASLILSSFISVSNEHTVLTSECGSMLEEVLVITDSLPDVYGYAKEASITHKAFMTDLSKAMMILLPLEASLSSDVTSMTDAISKEKESGIDISPIYGEALYQSYCFRLQEACQILESLIPSITFSVKELYSMLTKLARAASIHAGSLHKALECLADSQVVISQEISSSRPDFLDGMHANEKISLGPVESVLFNDFVPVNKLPSDEEGWISPPDCSYTSSQAFSLTPTDIEGSSDGLEQTWLFNSGENNISRQESLSHEKSKTNCIKDDAHSNQSVSSIPPILGKIEGSTALNSFQMLSIEKANYFDIKPSDSNHELCLLPPNKGLEGSYEDPIVSNPLGLFKRGKNAYAMSALRQIECKIEGRDIEDDRVMQASQLVDHLIKEATNIDNLCNMYEGWTPWI